MVIAGMRPGMSLCLRRTFEFVVSVLMTVPRIGYCWGADCVAELGVLWQPVIMRLIANSNAIELVQLRMRETPWYMISTMS